jgi:hypothetical protein
MWHPHHWTQAFRHFFLLCMMVELLLHVTHNTCCVFCVTLERAM